MNTRLAIEAFRMIGKPDVVQALSNLEDIDECNLLAGHLACLLGTDNNIAQVSHYKRDTESLMKIKLYYRICY